MDAELTGGEMLAIRAHLSECAVCNREHEELRETKNLLARLGAHTPRADLEVLLLSQAETSAKPFARYAPTWLVMRMGAGASLPAAVAPILLRPRPLAATALLSLAGLVVATVKLDSSGDVSAASGGSEIVAVTPVVSGIPSPGAPDRVYMPSPVSLPLADATPLTWSRAADGGSALLLSARRVSGSREIVLPRAGTSGVTAPGRVSIIPASFAAPFR